MSSVVMMTTVSEDTTGDKIQADGYYGYADGLHTVAFYMTAYSGLISVQATLASTPVEVDWFDLFELNFTNSTETRGMTFTGNYVYLRAKASSRTAGTINKILLKI
jgi:hypothetical protein